MAGKDLTVIKKILSAGKGTVKEFRDGTKAVFDYRALVPIDIDAPLTGSNFKTVDDTKKNWPEGYGKPLEMVFGKKFQLPVFEKCIKTMLIDEIAQFDVDPIEVVNFPMVSKKLRDIVKPRDRHDHQHHHGGGMCAASLTQGTGYPELDELMRQPKLIRFVFHLLEVTPPEGYEAESWQLTSEEKLISVETLRQRGNQLYKERKYSDAIIKYKEALGRLDTLMLREKPGEPEWTELDMKNITLYLNLSQCYLMNGKAYEAMQTATEVLNRDENNEKALYRRAKAFIATWQLDEAEMDLDRLYHLHPNNRTLVKAEKELVRVKRMETAEATKAISNKMMRAFGN